MMSFCVRMFVACMIFCFFKQKTAYEMRISDWSSDVCSSDLDSARGEHRERDEIRCARSHRRDLHRMLHADEHRADHRAAAEFAQQLRRQVRRLDRKSVV